MTPIIVEGKTLLIVKEIKGFGCTECACNQSGCVRSNNKKELYFEDKLSPNRRDGSLYCLNDDIVFIKNTPKQIAEYVAARLEST